MTRTLSWLAAATLAVAFTGLARAQSAGPLPSEPPATCDKTEAGPVQVFFWNAQEARTGSVIFGFGVNADSGLTGGIVLNEKNFDQVSQARTDGPEPSEGAKKSADCDKTEAAQLFSFWVGFFGQSSPAKGGSEECDEAGNGDCDKCCKDGKYCEEGKCCKDGKCCKQDDAAKGNVGVAVDHADKCADNACSETRPSIKHKGKRARSPIRMTMPPVPPPPPFGLPVAPPCCVVPPMPASFAATCPMPAPAVSFDYGFPCVAGVCEHPAPAPMPSMPVAMPAPHAMTSAVWMLRAAEAPVRAKCCGVCCECEVVQAKHEIAPGQIVVHCDDQSKLSCEKMTLSLAGGCTLAIATTGKQVTIAGPMMKATCDSVTRSGPDELVLEGHVHLEYNKDGLKTLIEGDHIAVAVADGHLEVMKVKK